MFSIKTTFTAIFVLTGVPESYDSLLLVLDKHWKEANPIKMIVITGTRPLK